jgi:mRNA interferase RelE/StbE
VGEYRLTFVRSARKDLEVLDRHLLDRIFPKIEQLADEPRPPGCRKIRGAKTLWRIRVGEHRVVYHVSDTDRLVDIIAVRHRKDAYR